MNLNKLFKQFKIRKKLTIAFTLLATVPVLLTGFFGINYTIALLEENSLQQLQSSNATMQVKVDRFLNETQSDIFYLRDAFVFRQLIHSLGVNNRIEITKWKAIVQEQFHDFVQNRKIYFQIRFLDRFATELMRVEQDGPQTVIVPDEHLSRRQDVFYLYYTENSEGHELLYTPVELTSDRNPGEIVPAISYFLPVYDDANNHSLCGILIANVYAQKLFAILGEEPPGAGRRILLVDNDGYYLFNSDKKEWNKLLALRKEGNVGNDFPKEVGSQILSGKEGLINNEWNEIIAYTPIYFTGSADNFMVLLQCISRELIRQPITSFMKLVIILGTTTFMIALFLGFLAANQFTRPIKTLRKGAEMLAKDRLTHHIKIDTNDEIEQLANDFNHMADVIKTHKERLQNYTEELESKVQERTEELSETLNYLQNLIESSVDAIITLDLEKNITFFSRGAEAVLGMRSQEVLGAQICSYCQCRGNNRCPIVAVTERGETLQIYQIDFMHQHGESVPLNMSVSPIKDADGKITGILTISKDMTEQKTMEQQIQQAEKLAGIGQLAAGMAHQLNTPLASIILSAQMLGDLITDDDILDDIETIERQADHCKRIIQDVLSFSRMPQKQQNRIVLEDVIKVTLRLMEKEFSARKIQITTNFTTRDDAIIGNSNQIQQLFFNLFNNACDAMREGGEIKISTRRKQGHELEVSVADTGVGIDEKDLNKIFDPFFTTKEEGRGTGLGLSVCYGIAEQHGGNIEVESKVGAGTTFTIRLPVCTSEKRRTSNDFLKRV